MNPLRCGRVVRGGLRCTYVPSLRFSTCPSSSSSPSSSLPSTSTSISAEKERSFRGRVENKGSHEVSNTRRLDAFLCSQLPDLSRARIQESVRAGTASVNGRVQIKPAFKLRPGDEVICEIVERPPLNVEPENIPLDIVYEDDYLLVVDKPSGLVVHPAPGNHSGTLVNAILHHCNLPGLCVGEEERAEEEEEEEVVVAREPYSVDMMYGNMPVPRPGIVHRLDKGTSGLMVVAKDDLAKESMQSQFRARTVERQYVSILCGQLKRKEGSVVTAIGRDRRERTRMAAYPVEGVENKPHLKRAASKYAVMEVFKNGTASLVSWRLQTGRTHQIRVHAKHLGAPLLGDSTYGGKQTLGLERPALHAATLGFLHPVTEERMKFKRDPPQDFLEALATLRKK